jgi:acyl-CoA synthetase (AMP-forming)/AMP-acid ligase II
VSHADILAHLGPKLARYKLPKSTVTVDALPRTASGKVRKDVLRQRLAAERDRLGEASAGASERRALVGEP